MNNNAWHLESLDWGSIPYGHERSMVMLESLNLFDLEVRLSHNI